MMNKSDLISSLTPQKRRFLEQLVQARSRATTPDSEPRRRPADASNTMSYAQERMWIQCRTEADVSASNLPVALRFRGPLDAEYLRQALQVIVDRHEILRTAYPEENDRPYPLTGHWNIDLPVTDLRHVAPADAEVAAAALVEDLVSSPIDVTRLPLVRTALFRLGPDDYILAVIFHHLVFDGWSVGIFLSELRAAYEAAVAGTRPVLPPLPIQYSDFAYWERKTLQGDRLDALLTYWKKQLDGAPAQLAFTPENKANEASRRGTGSIPVEIDGNIYGWLRSFCRENGFTPYIVLLSALKVVLARYSGIDDVVVGGQMANRNHRDLEPLIGLFVNPLALRTRVSETDSFLDTCRKVRETVTGALAHQDLPFDRLVNALQSRTEGLRHPVFNVVFSLMTHSVDDSSFSGLVMEIIPGGGEKAFEAKFDLTLALVDTGTKFGGALEFSPGLFCSDVAANLRDSIIDLLDAGLSAPRRPLHALPLMSAARSEALLREWARLEERAPIPERASIHKLFESTCDRHPDRPAIAWEDTSLFWSEVDERANRLARYLRKKGLGTERIGVCYLDRDPRLVIAVLAILKAGGAFLILEPRYRSSRVQLILADANPAVVITLERLKAETGESHGTVVTLDGDLGEIDAESGERLHIEVSAENLACVVYTSGSTGRPKGVACPHRGMYNIWLSGAHAIPLQPSDRVLQFMAVTFDGFFFELLMCWGSGAVLQMASWEKTAPGPSLTALLEESRINMMLITPSALNAVPSARLPDLHTLVVGGEASTLQLVDTWGGTRNYVNIYGPTEISLWGTCDFCRPGEAPLIGRPILNADVYILDRHLRMVPPGFRGEIYIGGAGVTRGFYNRPDLTADRYAPDPFSSEPGQRMYRSGDYGSWRPDGRIRFEGRIDDQVKLRGFRVEPEEIRACIEEHPSVSAAFVRVLRPPAGNQQLVAWVVLRNGKGTEIVKDLRRWTESKLPYFMRPSAWVHLDAMPLNPHGKVDRSRLPEPDWRRHEWESPSDRSPEGPAEQKLAEIWRKILGVETVTRDSNFFELGGDSIQSILVLSRARRAGLELNPRDMFERPTLAALAASARRAARLAPPDIAGDSGDAPLTPIMRWFLEKYGPASTLCQSMLVRTPADLSREQLTAVLQAILDAHDSLRLRLVREDDWRLRVKSRSSVRGESCLEVVDAHSMSPDKWRECVQQAASRAKGRLDLQAGRVFQAVWFQTGTGSLLLLVIHHMAVDGVSWRILLPDLETAARIAVGGGTPVLSPVPVPFRAWAQAVADRARTAEILGQLPLWEDMLSSAGSVFPGAAGTLQPGTQSATVTFPVEISESITSVLSRTLGAGAHELLLAALAAAIAAWRGSRDIAIDIEGHGREPFDGSMDLSRTVGWFTAIYPVRLDTRACGGRDLKGLVRKVRGQLRAVFAHSLSYGLLRYLNPEAGERLRALPDRQVVFNYLGRFADDGGAWSLANEDIVLGEDSDEDLPPTYLLDISAVTLAGAEGPVLTSTWKWSAALNSADVRNLVELWRQAVIAIADLADEAGPEDSYPLSPLQQGILYHVLRTDAPVYVLQCNLRLIGDLDPVALRLAWTRLLQRHTALRTGFDWELVDMPRQFVRRTHSDTFHFEDWRDVPDSEQDDRWRDFCDADLRRGFDLTQPPLTRCTLLRTSQRSHLFTWAIHHLIVDGWSLALLAAELISDYRATRDGRNKAVQPAPQYGDYIRWLQTRKPDEETYWRPALSGFTESSLIAEAGRAGEAPRALAQQQLEIGERDREALAAFCRKHQLTLNTLVQASWAFVLSRYAGTDDVLHGVTVSGRPPELPEVENIVGLFVNTLPLRVRIQAGERVLDWLAQVHRDLHELQMHSFDSLSRVQQYSGIPSGQPLFDCLVAMQTYPQVSPGEAREDDLQVMSEPELERTDYPLTILVEPADRIRLRFIYDEGRLSAGRVHDLMVRFRQALTALPQVAERRVCEWSLLTAEERRQIVFEWNRTVRSHDGPAFVHQFFEQQAAAQGDRTALVYEGQLLTYTELNLRANRLAHWMKQQGCTADRMVGVHAERGFDLIVALLAAMKSGAAWVPLEPDYPSGRIKQIIDEAQPVLILTQRGIAGRLPACSVSVVAIEDEAWSGLEDSNPVCKLDPDNLSYVIYTSGSTGRPKGAMNTHGGLRNRMLWMRDAYPLHAIDRALQKTPFSFDVSVHEFLAPLMQGASLVITPPGKHRDTAFLTEIIERERITVAHFVPSVLQVFLNEEQIGKRCRSVRMIMCSGEALLPSTRDRCFELLDAELINMYGPAEAAIDVTGWRCTRTDRHEYVPIGRPIDNLRIYVLDDFGMPVPPLCPGEVHIAGAGLARGYAAQPGLTAERFVPDSFATAPGELMYRTGDRARYLTDGNIEFLGRVDFQVKLRGQRIELQEIEEALRACPGVSNAAVSCVKDALAAYVVGETARPEWLRERLAATLPGYMIPSIFVSLPAIPLNANGKTDRRALPSPDVTGNGSQHVAPRTGTEKDMAELWAAVLSVPSVGVRDHFFFDLAGHSLLALTLLSRVRQKWHRNYTLAEFLTEPTVEAMARSMMDRRATLGGVSTLVPLQTEGSQPPLYIVHPALGSALVFQELAMELAPDQPVYAFQAESLDGGPAINDVGELAQLYAGLVESSTCGAGFRLGGYSYGGVVAFEMARRLAAVGAEPETLFIFDAPAPRNGGQAAIVDECLLLADIAAVLGRFWARNVRLSVDDLRREQPERRLALVESRLREAGIADMPLQGMVAANRAAVESLSVYQPGMYTGAVHLIRCRDHHPDDVRLLDPEILMDPTLHWQHWCEHQIKVDFVKGDHAALMRRPAASEVAKLIRVASGLQKTAFI